MRPVLNLFLAVVCAALAGSSAAQSTSGTASGTAAATPAQQSPASGAVAPVTTEPDPLLDVPPLPQGAVSLVGGHVTKVDPIRNHITLEPFGGKGKMKVFFDERSHIYRDGRETTQASIHKGDRVYVDTMRDGPHVFARNVRVITQTSQTSAAGQVIAYDAVKSRLTVADELSGHSVIYFVGPQTTVKRGSEAASAADLRPGSLVAVKFTPADGDGSGAQEVDILAVPGASFTFSGKVTHLDLRSGLIAVENGSDNKIYDISFSPGAGQLRDEVTVGSQVVVVATFTGKGYRADSITANQ